MSYLQFSPLSKIIILYAIQDSIKESWNDLKNELRSEKRFDKRSEMTKLYVVGRKMMPHPEKAGKKVKHPISHLNYGIDFA